MDCACLAGIGRRRAATAVISWPHCEPAEAAPEVNPMDAVQQLQRLFAHDEWANRETLESLRRAATPPPRAKQRLAHVIAAEWLWLGRLERDKRRVEVWPEMSFEQCETQVAELGRTWREYVGGITPERLSERIEYTNTKGERWTNTVEDILMHVIMHSAYHRGQVASELRAAGHTPAYTDFIHAVRRGLVG